MPGVQVASSFSRGVGGLERIPGGSALDEVGYEAGHEGGRDPGLRGGVRQCRLGEGVAEGLLRATGHHAVWGRAHHGAVALGARVVGQGERVGMVLQVVECLPSLVADVPGVGVPLAEHRVPDAS